MVGNNKISAVLVSTDLDRSQAFYDVVAAGFERAHGAPSADCCSPSCWSPRSAPAGPSAYRSSRG